MFGLDALSFTVSAVLLSSIVVSARAPHPEAPAPALRRSFMTELVEGCACCSAAGRWSPCSSTFSITLLGMSAVAVLFVPFMLRDLGASTIAVGFVKTAQTLGMLAGGALLARPAARWTPARALTLGIAGLGPCLALAGLTPHWLALLPLLALIGVCSSADPERHRDLASAGRARSPARPRGECARHTAGRRHVARDGRRGCAGRSIRCAHRVRRRRRPRAVGWLGRPRGALDRDAAHSAA